MKKSHSIGTKKLLAIMLLMGILCFVVACSSSESVEPVSTEEAAPTEKPESSFLTETTWVDIYSGEKVVFNEDSSVNYSGNTGMWSQEDNYMTLKYQTQNGEIELTIDILDDDDGNKFLRSRRAGKSNGTTANFSISEYYPEDKIEEVMSSVAKHIGDTISTDILEFTLKDVALAYYAVGASTNASDGRTTNVEEANSPSEDGGLFTANKGHCLACIDFILVNTDRGSQNTGDFGDYIYSFSVVQGENHAQVKGYDVNNEDGSYGLSLWNAPIAQNGGDFFTNDTVNIIMDAGEIDEIKAVGVVGFEPEELGSPFNLIVTLDNSSGETERFIYTID